VQPLVTAKSSEQIVDEIKSLYAVILVERSFPFQETILLACLIKN
jgi:hypothetical protein